MKHPTCDQILSVLEYRRETGELFWSPRHRTEFKTDHACAVWHTRFSGKRAGTKNASGYLMLRKFGISFYVHKAIWFLETGEWTEYPRREIDHRNGLRDDNRFENLMAGSKQQNARNQKRFANNTSGETGVHWNKRQSRWVAYINSGGRRIHLGAFEDREEAIATRREASERHGYASGHGKVLVIPAEEGMAA